MKIKMVVSIAGADFVLSPGDETGRFSEPEALRMIEAGSAVPIDGREPERAVTKPAKKEKRG